MVTVPLGRSHADGFPTRHSFFSHDDLNIKIKSAMAEMHWLQADICQLFECPMVFTPQLLQEQLLEAKKGGCPRITLGLRKK